MIIVIDYNMGNLRSIEKALKKLHSFTLTVGSPKILREDPLLDYVSDDAWGNILKIANWRHEKAVKLEGKPMVDVPLIDWTQYPAKFTGTQPYVVNASYTPAKNGIYIPLKREDISKYNDTISTNNIQIKQYKNSIVANSII